MDTDAPDTESTATEKAVPEKSGRLTPIVLTSTVAETIEKCGQRYLQVP
jgi:hypothetical protein